MTDGEREALRGRVAEAIGDELGGPCRRQAGACSDDPEFCGCQRAAAAALSVAEPALRARVERLEGVLTGTRAALVAATQAAALHNRTPAIDVALTEWMATAQAARAALEDRT